MFEPLLYVFLILFWLSVQISIKDFIIACKSDHFPSHFHLSVHCLHENWLEMMLMLLTKVRDSMMKMTVVEEYLMMKMAMVEDQLMKKTELLPPLSQPQHFHPAQVLHSYSAEVAFSSSLTGSWPHYDTSRYQCCDAATNSPEPSSYPSVSCGSRSHA